MFYIQTTTYPRTYVLVETLPAKHNPRDVFYPVPGDAIVHSKMYRHEKAQPYKLRAVNARGELLVEPVHETEYEKIGTLQEVDATNTIEGYRFKRYVLKPITIFIKAALDANKVRRSAAKRAAQEAARADRVGECPACFGDYVVRTSKGKDPAMVHHGYERPGYGYIVGDCHGVYHQPFELSCEGTKSFLGVLHMRLTQTEQVLKNLPTLTKISIASTSPSRIVPS